MCHGFSGTHLGFQTHFLSIPAGGVGGAGGTEDEGGPAGRLARQVSSSPHPGLQQQEGGLPAEAGAVPGGPPRPPTRPDALPSALE